MFAATLTRILAVATLLAVAAPARAGLFSRGLDHTLTVVRVNVTGQGYDLVRPWQKLQPNRNSGLGVVVGDGRILVQGSLVANATLVEVEQIGNGNPAAARVEATDYVADLALVVLEDEAFAAKLKPVRVYRDAEVGSRLTSCQFEDNGTLNLAKGQVKSVETGLYPTGLGAFLLYRVSIELPLGNTGVVPFFAGRELAGLMVGYRDANRTATLIPGPVIAHFLNDVDDDGRYDGFPHAGIGFSPIEDPQLRRYLKLDEAKGGVFMESVRAGGPAAKAGLKAGDVLLSIDGYAIDKHGQYRDPAYGRMELTHLITTRHAAGDEIAFEVFRDGETLSFPVRLEAMLPSDFPVEPILPDKAPNYLVSGGLVFQELSRELLRVWGPDWDSKAPRHLTRYDRQQWERVEPGHKVVVLVGVLPSPFTIGYDSLQFQVLKTVNGHPIHGIADIREGLAKVDGPFQRLTFESPYLPEIALDAALLPKVDAFVKEQYRLPALSNLPN